MKREEMIKHLIWLIYFVEGVPEEETRPVIERYSDETLVVSIDFYEYVAEK